MFSCKTLKPISMETLSGVPSFSRRRSHLESASYCTLSRIFSVCHELSDKHQNADPHANVNLGTDEHKISDPAKFGKPKLDEKIESLQLAVEKIDSVEPQNPNANATISSVSVANQTSDPGKFENHELVKTVEALQLVLEKLDSVEPQNPKPDATLCSVADKDQTNDSCKLDNSKLDETVEALQLAANKINSMEFQKPNPNATLILVADEDRTSDPDKIENPKLDETVEALQLVVENIDCMDEVGIDVSSNNERLNSMVSDLSLLVGGPIDQIQSGLGEFAPDKQMRYEKDQKLSLEGELNHESNQNQQIEVDNIAVHKIDTANDAVFFSSCQEIASAKEIEQLGVKEKLKGDHYNGAIEHERVEDMEFSLEIADGIQLEPLDEISNLGSSNKDQLNDSIEEGEITDDAQDLDDGSDLDNKVEPLVDDESEKDLVDMRSDEKLESEDNMPGLEHEKAASQNQGTDPSGEADEVGKKRKRGTAGRKARKKKLYRIKRAKKLREDGVKRLRLPPPVKKEKEKKICKFYLQGKCQQGGQCKFSHDVTPVTKSKACNHFARGECLKGDECPYDHDLSKYPCHKFVSEGMCIRGDNCKFSHNIQNTEGESVQTKEAGHELSGKSNTGEQTNKTQKSSIGKCALVDTSKHLNPGSDKSIEAPLKVPKGVRFLSFGADTKQEKHSGAKPTTKQNPHLMAQSLVNVPNKERENVASQAAGVTASGELSEASKILQEFLFGGLSATI